MSVERQTKEKFPKQRRLCKQRCSTLASIRSCPAWLEVCGTCEVYGLYCGLGVACIRSCLARLLVCGTCEGKLYMRTQKRDWDKTQPLNFLLLFFWCFFVCIRSSFRCICFGNRSFSLYVSFGSGSSSCFLIYNRLLY